MLLALYTVPVHSEQEKINDLLYRIIHHIHVSNIIDVLTLFIEQNEHTTFDLRVKKMLIGTSGIS